MGKETKAESGDGLTNQSQKRKTLAQRLRVKMGHIK
jgi:hypothetical protein